MDKIKLTSCMSGNVDFLGEGVARYLSARMPMAIEFVDDVSWQARETLLDRGSVHAGWVCGLVYIDKAARPDCHFHPLVAPVMAAPRYEDRPVYFSEIVVHRDSPFHTFADLRGGTWAYNEPHSYSGHTVVCAYLARRGETAGYFGRIVESGAHTTSLQMILQQEIDASAIDSTVLELELRHNPAWRDRIRVIDTLGPSPMPPWIISGHVPGRTRQALRQQLLQMDREPEGRAVLERAGVARFTTVTDRDYDMIRRVAARGSAVSLQSA